MKISYNEIRAFVIGVMIGFCTLTLWLGFLA
jgi:hypothetical protein